MDSQTKNMWKPSVIKQHLEQPCLVRSEVHLYQAERGKAPYRKMVVAWSRYSWEPATQLCSTALTSACSPSRNTAQTVLVAPYLHLLFEGDCNVPADTPGLCSSFSKLGCTTAGRVQYGSCRQDVCSSWIQMVKFCSKSSIPQKSFPNPILGEGAVSPLSTKRTTGSMEIK